MRRSAHLFLLAGVLLAGTARAGRATHLLVRPAQILPEGDVELEQWIWAEGRIPAQPARPVVQWVWWAPVVGVSPHLELAFPLQLVSPSEDLALENLGIEARYRIRPREEDEGLQPLIRLAYAQPLTPYGGAPRMELEGVTAYGRPTGTQLTIDLGASWALPFLASPRRPADLFLNASGGISVPLPRAFRISAEIADRGPVVGPASAANALYAGASLSWSHGPFWITAGCLFGLTDQSPRLFPKVLWAIQL